MKITFHYYVMKYYQTQWTDNIMECRINEVRIIEEELYFVYFAEIMEERFRSLFVNAGKEKFGSFIPV